MTYIVKNGTWCKDNEKEYYSTTKTGLKAALKAGEVTPGTRVVVHNPKYHAGQLIQSLNPECPEGCFVPHGQSFDTGIYEDLAKVFPDGKLPDLRECVLVCAGRSERTEITNHDEYIAGQFKDDQFAEHNHNVSTTVNDPGHGHTVTDPEHDHGRGTQNILGNIAADDMAAVYANGAFESSQPITYDALSSEVPTIQGKILSFNAANTWTGRSEKVTTGISVNDNTTGITVNTTEEKAGAADKVTHGKQFGVYYYIAF